ncbi:MAG: hypothetical protein ACXADF_16875, partial [Candidatus Thorarchaeota archaeon]
MIDEVCVILDKRNAYFEKQYFWPGDPYNRGFYIFKDLSAGDYYITLARSWVIYNLGEEEPIDMSWVGWDLTGLYEIKVKPDETVSFDIYLDFFCDKTWEGSIDNLRLRGSGSGVMGWGYQDGANWFGDNENLIGKTMILDVVWTNTALTRTDFTIEICDLA